MLVAPLLRVAPAAADLSGTGAAVIITSANAPGAVAGNPARAAPLFKLPLFAVGRRSADAARQAGFSDVTSAGGDVRDLVRLIANGTPMRRRPLLYLAAEDRAADLVASWSCTASAAEMSDGLSRGERAVSAELTAALQAGEVDAVLHFSKRSAENYIAGARQAGVIEPALAVRHYCLARPIAEPLSGAGAGSIAVARRPDEAALIDLLEPAQG